MPPTMVELRPNRRLLDHNFDGYRLNLRTLPNWACNHVEPVDKVYPEERQYSFVHAKLFALHNHLIGDYWDYRYNFYYIDNKQQVHRIVFNDTDHTFENSVVYDVPAHVERSPGHFNLCLTFPYGNLALISSGTGCLHIVDTGLRTAAEQKDWKTLLTDLVLGAGKYFVIIDSKAEERDERVIIHCLLKSVEQKETHFDSVLTWVTYENVAEHWKQTSLKQLQGKGIIHYAAIETSFEAVYVASDNKFKFVTDSEREIKKPKKDEPKKIIYTWLETTEDITLALKLPENFDKNLFLVNVNPLAIKISYAGKIFLEGQLKNKVDSEFTTWNVQESGQVDVLLTKSDSMIWNELIQGGDPNGEQILDPSLVEETHRRLAHLCSEIEAPADHSVPASEDMEECDLDFEKDSVLVRIDATNHEPTHRIPLSVNKYLFNVTLDSKCVPAVGLRHGTESFIWQPSPPWGNGEWPMKHEGTLMAFGYIQSSKQNRKFLTCPPDFSYGVVCEVSKHIFIYRSPTFAARYITLRQRLANNVSRDVKIGEQHIFNIERNGEVLGISATNKYLFVLTEKCLVVIEITDV